MAEGKHLGDEGPDGVIILMLPHFLNTHRAPTVHISSQRDIFTIEIFFFLQIIG
jgi:hypothetical protein